MFVELTEVEDYEVNGGLLGGIIVYGLNGACIGLATAFVASFTTDDWTGADTWNCIKTGAVTGACIGVAFPM